MRTRHLIVCTFALTPLFGACLDGAGGGGAGQGIDALGEECDELDETDCPGTLACINGFCQQCEESIQCSAIMFGGTCVQNEDGFGVCEFPSGSTGDDGTTSTSTTSDPSTTSPTSTSTTGMTTDPNTSTTGDPTDSTGGSSGPVSVDGDGCATAISGLLVGGATVDVTFRHASYYEVYSTNNACSPGVAPTYLGDTSGGIAAANAIAAALNDANPVPTCVAEQGSDFTGGDMQYAIVTQCVDGQVSGVFSRIDAGTWAYRADVGEAPFGASSVYVLATF